MEIDLIAIFVLGFLSSFSHCYGMCGGFVMAYSLKVAERKSTGSRLQLIIPHLMYNSGRVLTYTFLGFWFGLLGGSFKHLVHDYQSILFIFAGIFMTLMGLDLLGLFNISTPKSFPGFGRYRQLVGSLLNRANAKNIFLYGLILGFIPCGLVYIAGAKAVSAGNVLGGMATMLAFGLGTIPALFILGLSANLISARLRNKVFKIAAVFVILFGLFTVAKGVMKLAGIPMPWMQQQMSGEQHPGSMMEMEHD